MNGWKIDNRAMVKAHYRTAGVRALTDAVEHLGEEANRTAPIEEGILIGSGSPSIDASTLKAAWAYDTPYAIRQHEDTRLRHDPGRRAKWLEQTLKERGNDLKLFIGARMKAVLR